MNSLTNILKWKMLIPKLNFIEPTFVPVSQCQQVRNKWVDCRMKKDARKRNTFKEFGHMRMRYNAVRKNDIIPPEIQEIADVEVHSGVPRDATFNRLVARCQLTSKPRNVLIRWRLGRMMFRHLADGNRLSGVQRALWG